MKRGCSFEQFPYQAVPPEDALEFAAHCCGCDAEGEPHALAEISQSGKARPAPEKPMPRITKVGEFDAYKRKTGARLYATAHIGEATIEGWVVSMGVHNVVINSKHTRKNIEVSKEGMVFSKGPLS